MHAGAMNMSPTEQEVCQMKKSIGVSFFLILCMTLLPVQAQDMQAPSGQKTLAATMNVYVFPASGQASDQQSQDEAACYNWAVQNTGSDPFSLQRQSQQQQEQAAAQKEQAQDVGRGAGAGGALRGAAAGALIGEIVSDDAGKGAAYGAAAGAIRSRRRGRAARAEAVNSAEEQAQRAEQSTAQQMEGFKKAFAVCLEAKNYLVKW
jgi:hypothetical protein